MSGRPEVIGPLLGTTKQYLRVTSGGAGKPDLCVKGAQGWVCLRGECVASQRALTCAHAKAATAWEHAQASTPTEGAPMARAA